MTRDKTTRQENPLEPGEPANPARIDLKLDIQAPRKEAKDYSGRAGRAAYYQTLERKKTFLPQINNQMHTDKNSISNLKFQISN
jgi:hypothetical protein